MIGDRVPSSTAAASILREIFGGLADGFAFRLWDDTTVALGPGPARFTVVVHAPQTFRRLIRDPSPLNFAEAFVELWSDGRGCPPVAAVPARGRRGRGGAPSRRTPSR